MLGEDEKWYHHSPSLENLKIKKKSIIKDWESKAKTVGLQGMIKLENKSFIRAYAESFYEELCYH